LPPYNRISTCEESFQSIIHPFITLYRKLYKFQNHLRENHGIIYTRFNLFLAGKSHQETKNKDKEIKTKDNEKEIEIYLVNSYPCLNLG
jgi:hypothetical protein